MSRRAIAHRDLKPPVTDRDGVSIRWTDTPDSDRLNRIAEILADILDNERAPAEPEKP